jgi:hypothetical protein
VFLILLLAYVQHQVFATRPLFLVEIPGPSDNLTLNHNRPFYWSYSHNSYGPHSQKFYYFRHHKLLIANGEPVSTAECMRYGRFFPSPGLASVSYFTNGTNLNSTLWPFSGPETYENDSRIYQVSYAIETLPHHDKTPQQIYDYIRDIIFLSDGNHQPAIKILSNESSPTTIAGNPAYKVVYTYSYLHPSPYFAAPCKLCKATKIFVVKNNILYAISYAGDINKYHEFWPTVSWMINHPRLRTNLSICL